MLAYNEILVPLTITPRSKAALRVAMALSGAFKLKTQLVSVIDSEDERAQRRHQLLEVATEFGLTDPEVTVLVTEYGTPSIAEHHSRLMHHVRQSPQALLCMATHARGVIGDTLLGSVASAVLREVKRPLVLTGPQFSADWQGLPKTLLVCLDGSELSEAIVEPAVEFAVSVGAKLMLLQVLDPTSGNSVLSNDISESGYLQSLAGDIHQRYQIPVDWDVLHGTDPAKTLAQYVSAYPSAMVAMTTHGRTGLSKLSLGSVTRDLLHRVHCPVLAFQPEV